MVSTDGEKKNALMRNIKEFQPMFSLSCTRRSWDKHS